MNVQLDDMQSQGTTGTRKKQSKRKDLKEEKVKPKKEKVKPKEERENSKEGKKKQKKTADGSKSTKMSKYLIKREEDSLRRWSGSAQFECSHCSRIFLKPKMLERHISRDHNIEPVVRKYECYLCRIAYDEWMHLRQHFALHRPRDHLCTCCGFFASSSSSLRLHMMRNDHAAITKPHRCPTCGQAFSTKYTLDIHITTHSDVRDYSCSICGKAFKNKKNLGQHTLTHGEKKHKCQMCDYRCFSAGNLKVHMKVHFGRGGN